MRNGIMYKQGEILLISLPFSDLTSSKKRPVLVISNDENNRTSEDIVVAAITSNICKRKYSVMISSSNLTEGTLKRDSCLRADKIFSLSQNIVIRKFGKVEQNVINQVINCITDLITNK